MKFNLNSLLFKNLRRQLKISCINSNNFRFLFLLKKKLLLVALVVSVLLSLKLSDRYKKLLPLILVVSILPLSKLAYKVYDQYSEKTWLMPTDPIEEVTFAQKPNVYVIQPDGYVSKSMMESDLYNYETTMYNWLETNNLKIYDNILTGFFRINNISFWVAFKQIFLNLLTKRFFENYYEIDLAKELLEKYSFAGIILQNEIGPNEQILIQLAKIRNIPIYLMQHGLIFDTTEAITMNKYQGVLGINSDYQLVWGDVDFQYRKNMEFNSEKIIKIGSPIFDNLANNENSEKNYILLTTSGPTKEDIFDLTVETIQKNIDTIEKIAQIITSMNHKLVIKIHPSPDEFDPTELVKKN